MRLLQISINILILFVFISSTFGYGHPTHNRMSDEAYNASNLDSYLPNMLGISENDMFDISNISIGGMIGDILINDGTPRGWISEGSYLEDEFSIINWLFRFENHYYNPIDDTGLDFTVLGFYNVTGYPTPDWGLEDTQTFNEQLFSIRDARDYFYNGLTATTNEGRERNIALTFRTLGQVIHLIQDMAQPQHTRNDPHGGFLGEDWGPQILGQKSRYEDYVNDAIVYDRDPFTYTGYPVVTFNDYRSFFETTDGRGLSQFSNRNFVTHLTNFTRLEQGNFAPGFPEPILDLNNRTEEDIQQLNPGADDFWGNLLTGAVTFYGNSITDNYTGIPESDNKMTTYSLFDYDLESRGKDPTFTLNDFNFESRANILIPRAVGYSAGLLDYFFRGTLEITPPDQVAYSVTDGSDTPFNDNGNLHQQFTHIKAKVRNSTPDTMPGEEVQNCDQAQQNCLLQAIARYKIIPDYMDDLSNYPPDGTTMQNTEFSYSVSDPEYISSLSSATPEEFTFDFSANPIPAGITDLYLFVVFKGTLGNETDIAIAVGMKDLMEPTHQVLWNLTDMFSLDNHLYTSDEIRDTPSLFDRVDLDNDGQINEVSEGEPYIDPYQMTFGVGYLSEPPGAVNPFTYSAITVVQEGRHIRLIALVDKPQDNYLALEESNAVLGTSYYYFASPGVVNQEEDGVWQTPTPIMTFRYGLDIDGITQIPIRQHFENGALGCYPIGGTDPYGNPACSYPEEEAIPAELLPFPIDTVYFP